MPLYGNSRENVNANNTNANKNDKSDNLLSLLIVKTRVVTVFQASNTLGQVWYIQEIAQQIELKCSQVCCFIEDGVPAVPHVYSNLSSTLPATVDWYYVVSYNNFFGPHLGMLISSSFNENSSSNNNNKLLLEFDTLSYKAYAGLLGLGEYLM